MTAANEDVLQKLARSIVEIISDIEGQEDSTTLGTGFVVTDSGLIVTCRHVIAHSQDKLRNSVKVRFHSDSKTDVKEFTANLAKSEEGYRDDPSIDIAFLKLDKLPEKGVTPVKLDDKVVSLNHFASIGFKKAEEFTGLAAKGEIRILTQIRISKDVLSPEMIQLHSPNNEIEPGMSGAPVLDMERDRVVGIITERYIEQYNSAAANNMAFALPIKSMLDLYPALREKNQGLTVLSKFLRAIGEEETSIYKWIDEVYVPPVEYEDIKESLKRDRVVFITGTKEFGKTFTAVRLMYEFFKQVDNSTNNGYDPKWIRAGKETGREGADPKELLRFDNEDYIKPHQIVYIEDPFGKREYERSADLEDRIGSIIDSMNNVQDAYVIITSREEVFKKFKSEQRTSVELENFEKKLNLKKASYNVEKRKEMLLRWAKVNNCKWLRKSDLTNIVLEAIDNQELLPTPLNIKDFVRASRDILDSEQLKELMKQKSRETTKGFAQEIMAMKEDEKIIFLAFTYVGHGRLDIEFVKKMYEDIRAESNLENSNDFDKVKKWFEGDKINIYTSKYLSEHKIAFSHPSYHEAFRYAIRSEKDPSRIRKIFINVLSTVAEEDEAASCVPDAIVDNLDILPPNIQYLLYKFAKKKKQDVASAIVDNFNNLPADIQSNLQQLLFKLADNDEAAGGVARAIAWNFNNLPPDVQQQLLFKLADNDNVAFEVATAVKANFDKLRNNIREELLLKLSKKDKAAKPIVGAIGQNFYRLPPSIQGLIFKLAANENTKWLVADDQSSRLYKLPADAQQLLFKLADNDKVTLWLANAVRYNFDTLPSKIREQLLLELAENNDAAFMVATTIVYYYDSLPPNIQQLLFKLADNKKTVKAVLRAINEVRPHYRTKQIPDNIRVEILAKHKKWYIDYLTWDS